jgi:hypothetical protein
MNPSWTDGKPYHSFDYEMKQRFGQKMYKISLDGGMTCPNRDGTLGTGGCIFCSAGGSGDFAVGRKDSIDEQIREAAEKIQSKLGASTRYIAYFQSYTNTYAPVSYLQELFMETIRHPQVAAMSIGTRPDCLPEEVLDLCAELNAIKPVWIELGLQTIHPETAKRIRRGYELPVFEDCLKRLRSRDLECVVHVILGLPGETRQQMLETVEYLAGLDIQGIKLQLLHVLKGTELEKIYQETHFPIFSMEEYIDLVIDCIAILPPEITIHRLTGDGPRSLLIAPLWSTDKKRVLNTLHRRLKERGVYQGCQREK